jgi:4-hydroxybenzoate polyprenyltransferase
MARWLIYLKERFPLVTYLLLVGAMTASGVLLFPRNADSMTSSVLLAGTGLLLFFFELRLMDEWKDFEKDKIAHPSRPLPRGLIRVEEVRQVMIAGMLAMMALSGLLAALGNRPAGALYLGITVYLALMFKEFFVGKRLASMPFFYGVTHQVILVPLMAFPAALAHPGRWLEARTLWLGVTALGGFFTYELCRKLDPNAHPVLRTYPQVYGSGGTLLRILLTGSVGMLGATFLHLEKTCIPVMSLVLATAIAWSLRPRLYKVAELMATIGLLVHLACIPLSMLF